MRALHRAPAGCRARTAAGGPAHVCLSRRNVLVAASRSNWRSEIEGNGASTSTTEDRPSSRSGSGYSSNWRAELESSSTTNSGNGATNGSSSSNGNDRATNSAAAPQAAADALASVTQQVQQLLQQDPDAPPLQLPSFDLVGFFADGKHQAGAFTVLAATSAILSVLCCVEPDAVLQLATPNAYISDLDVTFVRIIGVTLAASAAVEYSLKHAAESQLLKSATYQRLMAACAIKSVGFAAVLLANAPATFALWSAPAWFAYLGTAVGATAVNLSVIANTSGNGLVLPPVELKAPANTASWAYSVITALYLLTAAACFAPETMFLGDPYSAITPLVKGVWAPGFFLAAVMSYVLKDAADRERLGASTFKNLNLGLAALEYGYSIIFSSALLSDQVDLDGASVSNFVVSFMIASYCVYIYNTAKK